MIDKVKLIVDGRSCKVEEREGKQTCVFLTTDGREVLFQRSKRGGIVKVTNFEIDCFSMADARALIAEKRLLDNPIIEQGPHHTVKKVKSRPLVENVGNGHLSRWQLVHYAHLHAKSIDPHEKDN